MTIGGGIALIIIGAILTFAVGSGDTEYMVGPLNVTAVGWILMIGGLAGLIAGIALASRRRTYVQERPVAATREREVVRDRSPM